MNSVWSRWVLPVILLATLGCGSSGGGLGGGPCVEFGSASAPGPATVVAQEDSGSSACQMIVVELWVTDVNDLFGADFTVNFDSSAVSYVSSSLSTTNSILASGGVSVIQDINASTPGELIIGLTRTNPATAIDVVGTQRLCTLTFQRVGTSGVSSMTFSDEQLLDDSGPPLPVAATWSGGDFTIIPM